MKGLRFSKPWLLTLVAAALLASHGSVSAQATGQVSGSVTGDDGSPLSGASVNVQGTDIGAVTGANGRFTLTGVPAGQQTVQARLIGYVPATATVTVAAGQSATTNFVLVAQAVQLEGIVAVGYGTQRRETLTGAVSAVSGQDLVNVPAANVSNTLAGKLPGVVTLNSSGEPGYDGATIRIRGSHTLGNNSPLVVIDGVPDRAGGLDRIDPQDIESISVLKDASAAIYGSRAANGVILVTTKRGQAGAPTFTASFNQGFNQPTRLPEMADAATYLTMLNEINEYRGRDPAYSEDVIAAHRDPNSDPWLYHNTDWFDEVIKPVSLQSRAQLGLRGGAERIRYYLSLGAQGQDGYYENSATRYDQYSFRTNVDAEPTDFLNLRFDLTGRLEDRQFPVRGAGAIFRMTMRGKPNLPARWPNGLPGPDIEYGDNPAVVGTNATGYQRDERYYVQGNLGLDFEVPNVDGLKFTANAAIDQNFQYNKSWRTPWTLYTWDYVARDENGEPLLTPSPRGFSQPELDQRDDRGRNILLNFISTYTREFGDHSLTLLGGVERQTSNNSWISAFRKYFLSDQLDQIFAGSDLEKNNNGNAGVSARQNYFGRINYDYQDKYLIELIGRYDGSYIFPEDKRFGFFPSVSLGWRISEEPFFQNAAPFFNDLKLRGSWGQTGNDRINAWQYMASYGFGGGYVFGEEVKSIYQTRTPNPNVTWEVANQLDIGLEGSVLDNRLSFVADWFDYNRTGILIQRNASVPFTAGLSLPAENIGKVSSWGWDGSLSWAQEVGSDASFDVTLNGGYSQNKIDFWDEAVGEDVPDYQRSTGHKMNTGLFYQADGVFRDSAELMAYPHWANAQPGDIRFKDVNGDDVINWMDRVRSEANRDATYTAGLNIGGQKGSFDMTVFFQGAWGGVQYLETESGDIGNFLQEFAERRWTPENPNGQHPRTYNRQDEYWISNDNTYFLRSTDYIRLKTVELGYRLPDRLIAPIGMENMRVYVSGFNVLTWDDFKVFDPEATSASGQYYPQSRVLNVGTSLTF